MNTKNKSVLTIGNFDGVHLGHQEILRKASDQAQKLNIKLVVMTFNPHPVLYFNPLSHLSLLMPYSEKIKRIESFVKAEVHEQVFDDSFSQLTAEQFFFENVIKKFNAQLLVVGHDFSFGLRREGSLLFLRENCKKSNISLIVIEPQKIDQEVISSTKIRELLKMGQIEKANLFLGASYRIQGEVIHGDKRGRTIGFPTANMKCEIDFALKTGVYGTSVFFENQRFDSITNIGVRPTFHKQELKIETHLIDQNIDLYGKTLEVEFLFRIRDEKKFNSIDELKHQINDDIIFLKSRLN